MKYILTCILLLSCSICCADSIRGQGGKYLGRYHTSGPRTRYYSPSGQYQGSSITRGGKTRFYSKSGTPTSRFSVPFSKK